MAASTFGLESGVSLLRRLTIDGEDLVQGLLVLHVRGELPCVDHHSLLVGLLSNNSRCCLFFRVELLCGRWRELHLTLSVRVDHDLLVATVVLSLPTMLGLCLVLGQWTRVLLATMTLHFLNLLL